MSSSKGKLAHKKALITGAGQGIGSVTVDAYVAEGAEVIATDINDQTLAELVYAGGR